MLQERVDEPHSQLPGVDQTPGPSGVAERTPVSPHPTPGPWSLPVGPPQRGRLRSPLAPGCASLLIILSPLSSPTAVTRRAGGKSGPRRWAAVASPGENSGQWVAMATPQALPQRPLGSRKGPLPCLQGAAPPCPALTPSLARRTLTACSGLEGLGMNTAGKVPAPRAASILCSRQTKTNKRGDHRAQGPS